MRHGSAACAPSPCTGGQVGDGSSENGAVIWTWGGGVEVAPTLPAVCHMRYVLQRPTPFPRHLRSSRPVDATVATESRTAARPGRRASPTFKAVQSRGGGGGPHVATRRRPPARQSLPRTEQAVVGDPAGLAAPSACGSPPHVGRRAAPPSGKKRWADARRRPPPRRPPAHTALDPWAQSSRPSVSRPLRRPAAAPT